MALTYSIKRRGSAGDLAFRVVDITLDANYAAGGYTLTPQLMGFGSNGSVVFALVGGGGRAGFFMEYDQVNNKLIVRDFSGGVGAASPEVANALAGLNGVVVRVLAFGVGHG